MTFSRANRMKQFFIALDQLINTCCFWLPGGSWADETLSARAWRIRGEYPKLHKTIDTILFFDSNHCEESYLSEKQRLQSPVETR